MKKFLLLSVAAIVMVATANAQTNETQIKNDLQKLDQQEKDIKTEVKENKKELRKLEGKDVNVEARNNFYRDFGNIPATWKTDVYYDEATFTKDGQIMIAYYDYDGNLVGTTQHKNFSDLPANAQNYINKKYSGYNKGDVIFFDDNELNETDMVLYGLQFQDADNYFVPLKKDNHTIILQVNMSGDIFFFKQL
jgi:hypothetical protein